MRILSVFLVAGLCLIGAMGYGLLQATLEAEIYRERWLRTQEDLASLRDQYNTAVRRTAVTELISEDGHLDVVVRTATGELDRIATPFDPNGEIYVDFVVLEGRIWIRRIFDSVTPPATGLVIDSELAQVDWTRAPEAQGKAAYRALGEGRWVVSVTGDGSLGLAPKTESGPVELAAAPPVRSYEPIGQSVSDRLGEIEVGEVVRALGRRVSGQR